MKKILFVGFLMILCGCSALSNSSIKTEISERTTTTTSGPSDLSLLEEFVSLFQMPKTVYQDIELIEKEGDFLIKWKSNKNNVLSNKGKYGNPILDQVVTLTAEFTYKAEKLEQKYDMTVKGLNDENLVDYVMNQDLYDFLILSEQINLNEKVLQTVNISYRSLNKEILSDDGIVNLLVRDTIFSMEVIYQKNEVQKIKVVEMIVPSQLDMTDIFLKENQFDEKYAVNMLYDQNQKFVVEENALEGTYYSKIYQSTIGFESLVGCFNMNTSENFTGELQVRILIEGKWSQFFTYGEFGLYRQNRGNSRADSIAKIFSDEIKPLNNKKASGFNYKLTVRRTSAEVQNNLRQITISLKNPEYKAENLAYQDDVNYEVPKLNQNVVPVIGNSICSPTSLTMLLKYKGMNFTEFDEFENRYIANLANDYGNNIFGNWVYNCLTASGFGWNAYPKYINSIEELKSHLTNVGPVAASVKGDLGLYTTGGHLLVVKGYYKDSEGREFVRINDPNLRDVEYNYTMEVFLRVWKNLIYIFE